MHLSLVLLLISLSTPTLCIPGGTQMELTHVDYGRQLTKLELVNRAARRSQIRAKLLSSKCYSDPISRDHNIPIRPSGDLEYVLELSIGTPPRSYPLMLDTGSGLVWTQCKLCSKCVEQPSALFDPSKSSTYSPLPCSDRLCQVLEPKKCKRNHCMYFYADASPTYSYGGLARETFTFGTGGGPKVHVVFGCGTINRGDLNNSSGIAGFSRQPTSLVSQLGVSGFSHCMTDDINKKSSLRFGTHEEIFRDIMAPVQTTKFVKPLRGYESLYFVAMTGITVGTIRLNIPKSVFAQGMLVDSGTAFTQLPKVAFNKVIEALSSNLKLVGSNHIDTRLYCFLSPSVAPSKVKVPEVILHFKGMDLKLARYHYIVDMDDQGALCLAMQKTDSFGIFGNVQQVNMQVMYDLKNNKLEIAPNQCYKQ